MTNEIDWQSALDGSWPVTTRDGKKVTLYSVSAGVTRPIRGDIDGFEWPSSWRIDGSYSCAAANDLDLIQPPLPPKPFKLEFWVNVYRLNRIETYPSRTAADAWAKNRIACVRVVLEGHEGDGL